VLSSRVRVRLPRPGEREMCVHAEKFQSWVRDLFDKIDLEDRMQVHQAILQLSIQYYQWYFQVPQNHQVRVGPKGHLCIFHVFMHAFNDLMEVRTDLDPPLYTPPPPPPPPPRVERVEVPVPMVPSFSDQGTLLGLNIGSRDELVD
jgi:hypothetical protein